MKISIYTDTNLDEIEIKIGCKQINADINRIIEILGMLDGQITVTKDAETYMLAINDIYYIESLDKKTIVYTKDNSYDCNLKLYELQTKLEELHFLRISKSMILNLKQIKSLKADLDRRIKVSLNNDDMVIVSRQYSDVFKSKLGIK